MKKVPQITFIDEQEELSQELRINIDQKQKEIAGFNSNQELIGALDLTLLPIHVDIANIDQYPNEQYALFRKNGLGGSDSSAVLGVNPYTSRQDLIAEKARNYLTNEERAVGDLSAVKKGRDLEPYIIDKFSLYLGAPIMKPTHMYVFNDFPYLKMNFDGVTGHPKEYIPCEIKVVTKSGERHYRKTKAWFNEKTGFGPLPDDVSENNWSIETKAVHYGIPAYYYTQLQQEIMALNAPFGYLAVMLDNTKQIYAFFVWKDRKVQNAIILEGYKVWNEIETRRGPNWQLPAGTDLTSTAPLPSIPSGTTEQTG